MACFAGYQMATTSSWVITATTAATAGPGDSSRRETSSARSSTYSNDVVSRAIVLAFALLLPAGTRAAVTYSFDWYCSGCAKIGMGSNGQEGPYGSSAACESARASLSGSLATRGCGVRCFNPQACTPVGQPDILIPPAASAPPRPALPPAGMPLFDPLADRARRADEMKPA